MAVTHVLFDLGHVVLDWQPRRLYQQLFDDPVECDWFLANVCTLDWHRGHDGGLSWDENAAPLIAAYPQYENQIRAWGERWLDMFAGYVPGTPALMDRLVARDAPLYALSNVPSEGYPPLVEPFPKLKLFLDVIVSGDEKLLKPDPAIYHLTLARMGNVPAENVLFTDDTLANIEAADTLGFQTHHFKGADGLEDALEAHGLL